MTIFDTYLDAFRIGRHHRFLTCGFILLAGTARIVGQQNESLPTPTTNPPSTAKEVMKAAMEPAGKWLVHDDKRPQPKVVTPGASFSQGAPPPSDAEVLFDGHGLAKWENEKGENAAWPTQENTITSAHAGGIRTHEKWADFQLHVEWAAPNPPVGKAQGRGNSGILINNMYEIQVLDSYQEPTYPDGQAAAVYGQSPPLVNSTKPPGEWQTYDILFESPRWNERGELIKKAVVTVLHNGVVVQNHYELMGCTDGINPAVPFHSASKYPKPHDPEVFIQLQDHKSAVRFRNIWIRPMHLGENL
ncbi:MAG: DUF1080 domain-containing protein [bacterium]